jgi:hypothetical protein
VHRPGDLAERIEPGAKETRDKLDIGQAPCRAQMRRSRGRERLW